MEVKSCSNLFYVSHVLILVSWFEGLSTTFLVRKLGQNKNSYTFWITVTSFFYCCYFWIWLLLRFKSMVSPISTQKCFSLCFLSCFVFVQASQIRLLHFPFQIMKDRFPSSHMTTLSQMWYLVLNSIPIQIYLWALD